MKKISLVYESFSLLDYLTIRYHIFRNRKVWAVEPFHAYHHGKKLRFFPPHFPAFVRKLVKTGKISVLKADKINAKDIYSLAADRAVNDIESVYPEYRKQYLKIFGHVVDTLNSKEAENVFRISLCNKLAEYYSTNILLKRIEKYLNTQRIIFYTSVDIYSYFFIQRMLENSNLDILRHPNLHFSNYSRLISFFENLKQNLIAISKLFAQTIASAILNRYSASPTKNKKKTFAVGVTIISSRQLRKNKRGWDFLIDNKKIFAEDIVCFPLCEITVNQKASLTKSSTKIYCLPKAGRFFSNFHGWKKLLLLSVVQKFLRNAEELTTASHALFSYFSWQRVMQSLAIHHFITHADYGIGHIGRNLALMQAGVQTWYFTDSSNLGVNFQVKNKHHARHPFWTYLCYDHLVTWHDNLAQYYKNHPGSFKQSHIVGCLWSGNIQDKSQSRQQTTIPFPIRLDDYYVISCFDSTYSRNGLTSYKEGISFARHLLRLVEESPDIYLIFKEKKDRNIHRAFDPFQGPKLLEIYRKMESHPRISVCSNQLDASELISLSDLVVSFPFTSTTFEALSANKMAIWHDPMGYYRDTSYAKINGIVSHSYFELKNYVHNEKNIQKEISDILNQTNFIFFDPYRDGKAMDRFRNLLLSE